jgi:general secretion pathway protein A
MYLKHFDLSERPFSITPDPRFLYMSARHREALAHLLYGLGEGGGFVQLTGEVGTGKTTICRCLLEQVPENVDIAMVLNPKVTAAELIATVCDELGVSYPAESNSIKLLVDILNHYLLDAFARGRRTVLIIDEAQNLSADVLEQVRLLTNLETSTQKLLQIILIGQPELRNLLARDDMRQLSQRVTARYHLEPISRDEADAYIRHRLQICGASKTIFDKRAVDRIHALSGGIPRLINVLCDRALLGAYVEGSSQVDGKVVRKAALEVLAEESERTATSWWQPALAGGLLLMVLAVLAWQHLPWSTTNERASSHATDNGELTPGSVEMAAAIARDVLKSAVQDAPSAAGTEDIPGNSAAGPVETLDSLLGSVDGSWYRAAWKELFAAWAVDLPDSVKPDFCDYALQYGLLCLEEQGNWNSLRQFNRPAVLSLTAADGSRVPVFLRHLDGSLVEMMMGNVLYRTTIEQVDRFWYGDYSLLLQATPGGRLYLKMGDRSPDVAWIRQQLEIVQGVRIPTTDVNLFDFHLQKQVLEFQRSRGLVADGIVGKNTLIHLNSSTGREGVPVLQPAHPE